LWEWTPDTPGYKDGKNTEVLFKYPGRIVVDRNGDLVLVAIGAPGE
jgi:hypothetical protein